MTDHLNLAEYSDPRDAVHQVVPALIGGGLVRLDLPEGNWAAALATSSDAAQRLLGLNETTPGALMFVDADAAADLISIPSAGIRRLFRRGRAPMILRFLRSCVDDGLLQVLPEATRHLVIRHGRIAVAPSSGKVTGDVLRTIPGPLLVCEAESTAGGENVYDVWLTHASVRQRIPVSVIDVDENQCRLSVPGSLTPADLNRMMAQQIVFVCTGNTCRSPMAAAVCRTMLAERFDCRPEDVAAHGFLVTSAGLAAMAGAPASVDSVRICAEQGLDLRSHCSQPLTLELLEESDRLYTMTAGHRQAILAKYPEMADRVQMLSRRGRDVSDPIGLGRDAYEQCYAEIIDNLRVLVDELTGSPNER